MTTAVAAAFLETQLAFTTDGEEETTFNDNAVPGIGDAGKAALEDEGISNAAQVVGWFLRVNGDQEKFREFLVDKCGCHGPSVSKEGSGTVAVVREKCLAFVLDEVDEAVAPAETAAGTTKVMAAFISKQLSFKDDFKTNSVPGLGDVGRAKLAESVYGVTNAVQLIGHYMILNGDEEMFLEFLTGEECGIQERYAKNVMDAIREKIAPFCSA